MRPGAKEEKRNGIDFVVAKGVKKETTRSPLIFRSVSEPYEKTCSKSRQLLEFFLSPSGEKNGFSAQQPEQTGRLSPFIVVVLFGSGLGRMPGYLDKDRSRNPLLIEL